MQYSRLVWHNITLSILYLYLSVLFLYIIVSARIKEPHSRFRVASTYLSRIHSEELKNFSVKVLEDFSIPTLLYRLFELPYSFFVTAVFVFIQY